MSNLQTSDEFYTDIPVGEILRRARMQLKLTIPQVEIALRIRSQLLEALERSDYSQLPGQVYTIGFVRTYAEFLGLDGNKMISLLKVQTGNSQWRSELHLPIPVRETNMPTLPIIAASLGVMLLLVIVALFQYSDSQSKREIGYPPADVVESGEVQFLGEGLLTASMLEAFSDEAAVETDAHLVIKAVRDTWFELREKETNKVLYSGLLHKDDIFRMAERVETVLDTGNAAGLEITVDGHTLPLLGKIGEVKRGVLLEKAQNP